MTLDESTSLMTPSIAPITTSQAGTEDQFALPLDEENLEREKWREIIEDHLIAWGASPDMVSDEDVESPTREVLLLSLRLANRFRSSGRRAPLRVVPNGEGGVSFEFKGDPITLFIEIHKDETLEFYQFRDGRLIERFFVS